MSEPYCDWCGLSGQNQILDCGRRTIACRYEGPSMIEESKELIVYADTQYSGGSENPLEVQTGGNHYKSMGIQPIEYSMKNNLDALQHSIIKYVTRFRDKGGQEDLGKARHCIDLLEHFEYGGEK